MTVLTIIGVLIVLALLALSIQLANEHSTKVYGYEIFNIGNFILSVIAYLAIYFGNSWYMEALREQGDILNGVLLMGIGIIVLLWIIYNNIKKSSLVYGLTMSIITELLYAAATPLVFFAFIMAIAFFAQTKPVYNIND